MQGKISWQKREWCSISFTLVLQHPQIQIPRVYRMEFHLLNEREIKTIRSRTSARSCLRARVRARASARPGTLWFSLSASLTQRPRSIPASASIFFARLFLFLRYLTFLFFRDAPSSRRLLLHHPPSPNDPGGTVLSLAVREKKRDRKPSSLSSSRRVRVYSRPILSRRRHFAPFIDPAPTHSPAFPATFLSPDKPAACTSCSPTVLCLRRLHQQNIVGFQIVPGDSFKSLPFANWFVFAAFRPRDLAPVQTDLHRATEDRIETPLEREGENR